MLIYGLRLSCGYYISHAKVSSDIACAIDAREQSSWKAI